MIKPIKKFLDGLCCHEGESDSAAAQDCAPRRQRRKEARPAELLAAAIQVFAEKGYAGARMDEVAARAGVTKGTLYLYYDSKETLFKAVITQSIVPVLEEAEGLAAGFDGSAAELLACLMRGWWRSVGDTPLGGIPKLMTSEAQNFPELARYYYEQVIDRAHRLLDQVLQRGIARGEFRPLPVDYAYRVVFAPILMLMIWRHSFGPSCGEGLDPDLFIETTIDIALRGLQPGTPQP